ncbi:MAG: sulfurtransferase [Pseudomonadota bacterium]
MNNSDCLISVSELAKTLPDSVVFDCRAWLTDPDRAAQAFDEGHIPGAQRLDLETELSGPHTGLNGRHPLPGYHAFETRLRAAGVDDNTPIVLYDASRPAGAARAWWLLKYFGHTNARVLDGGLAAWAAAGKRIERGEARVTDSGSVHLAPGKTELTINLAGLQRQLRRKQKDVIDAREPDRYHGISEPIDPVAGRIPGAVNLPWTEVLDAAGHFLSADGIRKRWAALPIGKQPVVYCGSGVTACVLSLSRAVAGLGDVRLYPGGFSEWSADMSRTIETDLAD